MTTTTMNRSPRISLIALALASASTYAAPPLPDAGQISRELQSAPELAVPKVVAPLRVEAAAAVKANSSALRFGVRSIRVSGSTVFNAATLEALVADLTNGEHTLAELENGAARISSYYRQRGFVLARAYLPAQDIQGGAVTLRVLEGVLDQQRLSNQSRLSDAQAQRYLSDITPGSAINAEKVDRALLLLADNPAVGGARAALQPGASVGSSDLLVELDPAKAYVAVLEGDNYGNRYTGEYRAGAAVAWNNPLQLGDLLSLRGVSSGANMTYARLAYQLPVGSSGLHIGAAWADTRYRLGEAFEALKAHGAASSASVYASYAVLRSPLRNVAATLAWEDKSLQDQTDTVVNGNVDKQLQLLTLGLSGNAQDALGGGGLTAFEASLANGNLKLDAASQALDTAANSAHSSGSFSRLNLSLSRLQRVAEDYTLWLALSGQLASKNLGSSEKFSLGGVNGVRAYPQGEASGDEGQLLTMEARRTLSGPLQAVVFYDAGTVDANRNPFGNAATANTRFISGAGFGLNGQLGPLQFKTTLAWRTNGGDPVTDSAERNPRFWFQASLPL
jgi:hemolysin activation/secretion protein